MAKNLVIVESPGKVKSLEKFLGKDYKVMSCIGHVRDLPKGNFSQDLTGDFEIEYEVPAEKKHLVSELRSEARKADMVWLASDEDREGEAIAWHLYQVLDLTPDKTRRIAFHEITKPAILEAIENPRDINVDLVDAQQARRVLDRIVGFELSPVLWRKIKPALSAGRVQSVAVRLVCEREREIQAFVAEPYYRVSAVFTAAGQPMRAILNRHLPDQAEARRFLKTCGQSTFTVADVQVEPTKRSPRPPFTTSTLQQEANARLGFSVTQTMMLAQRLYEAGHITYMRTDSLNLSSLAMGAIEKQVRADFGDEYVEQRHYHTHSKRAQEAHEAIRPTYMDKRKVPGTAQEQRLYELIWKRTMASQMADARLEKTNIEIGISDRPEHFRAQGETVTFPGFMQVWSTDGKISLKGDQSLLPPLKVGEPLQRDTIAATESFTQPKPRYDEGHLTGKMEELGIGRPSTYASTISTIQQREYVRRGDSDGTPRDYTVLTLPAQGDITVETRTENVGATRGKLVPTDIGMVVNDFLMEHFPDILDYSFTAKVESKFDEIAKGELPWKEEINDFYTGFHPHIDRISTMRMEHKAGERLLGTDPASGKPVSVKIGRFGPLVQIGIADDDEKPRFASLQKNQSIADITLEEALKLFELPRTLGQSEGLAVKAAIGRFGPYVQLGKLYVSIPKEMSPHTITLEEAEELIRAKREAEANKLIRDFGTELPGTQVLNGRFGPYIAHTPEGARRPVNYRIPKGEDPATLTADRVRELMIEQDAAPRKTTRRRTRAAK